MLFILCHVVRADRNHDYRNRAEYQGKSKQPISHPISTADLANILHCSRAGVFRAFRQSFGNTPGQYITNVRIRHAQLLLQSTDMTVAQIASAVGIPDAAYFSKLFHRLSGCPAGC